MTLLSFSFKSSLNLLITLRSTSSLEPETQHCPVLKHIPNATPSAASSRFASAKTICGFLPPNSKPSFLKLVSPDAHITFFPTAVDPVKEIMSICGFSHNAWPTIEPGPVTTFITPFGKPAAVKISAKINVVADVYSDGLATIVQPAAKIYGTLSHRIRKGKFQGVIKPTTPIGSRVTIPNSCSPKLL